MLTAFWWGKVKERDHLEEINVDERILLKCMGRHGLDSCGLGDGQETVCCDHGDELQDCIKRGEFFDELRN